MRGQLLGGAPGAALVVRVAKRAEEPGLVAFNRPAERHVVLMHFARRRRARRQVVRVPAERLIRDHAGAAKLVAAALAHHVDDQAVAHGRRGVDAAGLHLGVLDGFGAEARPVDVEVVVVAGVEALHQRHGVAVFDRIAEIVLAAARIVVRARDHARREHQEVAPELPFHDRRFLLEFGVDRQHVARLGDFEHRRIARHRDRLFERAELERHVHLEVAAGAQQDAFAARQREARELRRHVERARRQVDQPVLTGGIGNRDARGEQHVARRRHGYTRKRTTLTVSNGPPKTAVSTLGPDLARCHEAGHDG